MRKYLMALDQGTTSSRCILFTEDGIPASVASKEYEQIFPRDGWVEHDPMQIFSSQTSVALEALLKIGASWNEVIGIGITNQRETVIVWDKDTGKPIYNAIVWQCRRTADYCEQLKAEGYEPFIKEKTGLVCDPYFSASKIKWILDNVDGAREKAEKGELLCGTVDTWLMWNLSGRTIFATDVTNASRTILFNIHTLQWDDELLSLFNIPRSLLPEVKPSSGLFGYTDHDVLGERLPIAGVAGDQQAAMFGQGCTHVGDVKNTYGTGGFLLMNIGHKPIIPKSGILTTLAWSIGGEVTYASEGSVFVCGAAIQWLRDGLKLIDSAKDTEEIALRVQDCGGVYVVPAFCGLGAPYWDPYARGSILGITRATTREQIVRATVESMAYQTNDLLCAIQEECGITFASLKADGGAAANNFLLSFQAGISGLPVLRPTCTETTALGAALLAGIALGIYTGTEETSKISQTDKEFLPNMSKEKRTVLLAGWKKAVEHTKSQL